ncbi:unnamed protein product [Menidia menidia]|uniref:(Atlantic silverside) hypothetical protein n=1 Tax=Menidia menidia TaxID=238744 RepID=A0A8S4BT51_9TELE|nr:unnamed protein product [Menidia menidia]
MGLDMCEAIKLKGSLPEWREWGNISVKTCQSCSSRFPELINSLEHLVCAVSTLKGSLPEWREERLTQVQEQIGQPALKLVQEVDSRWNRTYQKLQRVYELREPGGAVLAGLRTDVAPLSSEQYSIIAESLKVLSPFNGAAVKPSEERRVS